MGCIHSKPSQPPDPEAEGAAATTSTSPLHEAGEVAEREAQEQDDEHKEAEEKDEEWTDARVLVELRRANPSLEALEGWADLTAGSDLRTHKLEGINEVNDEGRVEWIVLFDKGLVGE